MLSPQSNLGGLSDDEDGHSKVGWNDVVELFLITLFRYRSEGAAASSISLQEPETLPGPRYQNVFNFVSSKTTCYHSVFKLQPSRYWTWHGGF